MIGSYGQYNGFRLYCFSTTDNLALLKGAKCTATSLKYGLCNTEEEFDYSHVILQDIRVIYKQLQGGK